VICCRFGSVANLYLNEAITGSEEEAMFSFKRTAFVELLSLDIASTSFCLPVNTLYGVLPIVTSPFGFMVTRLFMSLYSLNLLLGSYMYNL